MAAKIRFEFKESSQFRIVHVDGAFGGPTPTGNLFISMYNERNPIPESVVHSLDGTSLGQEIMSERVSGEGITRTQEVGLVMSVEAASAFRDWLGMQIEQMRKQQSDPVVSENKH